MPRVYNLSWQPGINGRQGRWRKKYKQRIYYFPGGRGKTDSDARAAAEAAWEKKKLRIDAAAPKPNQAAYEQAIAAWELVLAWCHKHREEAMADVALQKLDVLRKGLSAARPAPVASEDTFEGQFDRALMYPELDVALTKMAEASMAAAESASPFAGLPGYREYVTGINKFVSGIAGPRDGSSRSVVIPSAAVLDMPDSLGMKREVWRDRLDVMQRSATPEETTAGQLIEKFLVKKKEAAGSGELSTGRAEKLRFQLGHFRDWLGTNVPANEISSESLIDYRAELLKAVQTGTWSRSTAKDRLSAVKSFVLWLWESDVISDLPRVLGKTSKTLLIGKSNSAIVTFTKDEIRRLLVGASKRTKLYLLLMLNTGMTQKDIADLDFAEVNWDEGQISRKRSKTKDQENVPVVTYALWPETLELLRQERSSSGRGRVLLNAGGEPLWYDVIGTHGKYQKNDNVRNAYERLRRKLAITKSLKSLRKTSATMIGGHKEYRGLEDLFLGHAPRKMSEQHYVKPPQDLLHEAVGWLREAYDIGACCSTVESVRPDNKKKPRRNSTQTAKTAVRATRRRPR